VIRHNSDRRRLPRALGAREQAPLVRALLQIDA
jgi:hypothetical protein